MADFLAIACRPLLVLLIWWFCTFVYVWFGFGQCVSLGLLSSTIMHIEQSIQYQLLASVLDQNLTFSPFHFKLLYFLSKLNYYIANFLDVIDPLFSWSCL